MYKTTPTTVSLPWILTALLLLPSLSPARAQRQAKPQPGHWVGTWAAAQIGIDNATGTLGTAEYTVRDIVHTSLAGKTARAVLSNEMGTRPLTISSARVALSAGGSRLQSTGVALTFNGGASVTIPVGAKVFSDSFALDLPAGSNVAVSLFLPAQAIPLLTVHSFANQSNYTAPGDQTAAIDLTKAVESDSWYLLSALEVQAPASAAAIVTLGDSITDGAFSTRNGNVRWPDDLARRLQASTKTQDIAVLNEGIGGNRVLHNEVAPMVVPSVLGRFDRDVLSLDGVKYLILFAGVNDIGIGTGPDHPRDTVSADDLALGISQMIERAHAHGIRVFVGTIMPYKGLSFYYTAAGEAERQAVNHWIRTSKLPDGIVDFDEALRDPADPQRLLPALDRDHIHPNDAGHKAMADAVDLNALLR
jgi:lysophospholipase L1-like esterase